ncbi:hypothetical protein DID88_007766 [Monilinia fructigena]|uniref:Uncharacterized protein n=1 Tax=Monilinia fructigena TaxID=38457 RepID=A0A395J3Y4_9HELO|nr:hypothetical protein DID88_007766 [Monilinia fructigena]
MHFIRAIAICAPEYEIAGFSLRAWDAFAERGVVEVEVEKRAEEEERGREEEIDMGTHESCSLPRDKWRIVVKKEKIHKPEQSKPPLLGPLQPPPP